MNNLLTLIWNFIFSNKYLITTSATVLVTGYMTQQYGFKEGIVIHDQGNKIEMASTAWDLENEPRKFSNFIAQFTEDRFHNGCSYHVIIVGDSAFKYQYYNRLSYHAKGMNEESIGVMLTRTDNEEFNQKTLNKFVEVHGEIVDSLDHYFNGCSFSLFHSDVATNGKEDPHEFRAKIDELGLRYDNRLFDNLDLDEIPY